ncbi:TauD/TfdA family dioxygenase [Martelella sp. HB161492]|uniref:TauD/TfdA dioxygenase family protein n=1 Tax=Martelella sp. HB161492 TaxID=2720726 RepID=UPI00158FF439|nr:TauD/TfdA family dioxygenase [Martelella sp. HB161492]
MAAQDLAEISGEELIPGFGLEVIDFDINTASPAEVAAISDAFQKKGALVLRNQTLDADTLSAFAAKFGTLEGNKIQDFTLPGHPETYVLSNKIVDGKPIGAHLDGITWHTDGTYLEFPPMLTLLYCLETPPEGGETLVADASAAFYALPKDEQDRLDQMDVLHSYNWFMETRAINGKQLSDEEKRENPDVIHPFVRTHPVDGRKAFFISTGAAKEIIGLPEEEGRALVKAMAEHVTKPEFVYSHKWRKGDLLMWDDRITLHRASMYDDKKYERHMWRIWVRGERPV